MSTVTFSRLGRLGRLGNQLFQIAGALAVARRAGATLSLPRWSYAPWFCVPDDVFGGAVGVEADTLATHLGEAAPYLQDWALVAEVGDTVRAWFAPSEQAAALVPPHAGHRTGLHVRRTDYLALGDYYRSYDADWYRRAVALNPSDTTVHVYSDDIAWCRANLPADWTFESSPAPSGHDDRSDRDGHPLPHPDELRDFFRLASADAVVAANSAFSWFAAFLSADPHPIVPDRWYGPAYRHLSEDRIIPPHWRRLP